VGASEKWDPGLTEKVDDVDVSKRKYDSKARIWKSANDITVCRSTASMK
jgi:hypothetical protein